jgi:hypothetical protein
MEQIIVDDQPPIPSTQHTPKVSVVPDDSTYTKAALGCLLLAALFAVRIYRDVSQPIIMILMKDAPLTLFRSMLPIRGVLLACWFTMALIQLITLNVKSFKCHQSSKRVMDFITFFLLLVSLSFDISSSIGKF